MSASSTKWFLREVVGGGGWGRGVGQGNAKRHALTKRKQVSAL